MALTYEFQLSDREFTRAWLAEYYRRPGIARLRVIAGPAMALIGWRMASSAAEPTGRWIGFAAMAFGIWHVVRPFVIAWMIGRRRARSGAAASTMRVTFDPALGITVADGKTENRFGWDKVRAAGRGRDYVWFELSAGARGTVPLRAVGDEAALVALLTSKGKWT